MAGGLARDPSRKAAHGWTFLKNVILLALNKSRLGQLGRKHTTRIVANLF